jgi:hypothetical protein
MSGKWWKSLDEIWMGKCNGTLFCGMFSCVGETVQFPESLLNISAKRNPVAEGCIRVWESDVKISTCGSILPCLFHLWSEHSQREDCFNIQIARVCGNVRIIGWWEVACKLRIVHAEWVSLVIQEFMKGSVIYSKMNWRHVEIWEVIRRWFMCGRGA